VAATSRRRWLATAALAALFGLVAVPVARPQEPTVDPGPTRRATCGPGSRPETGMQGRVSAADFSSGRAGRGFTCNTELVSHFGSTGGYKVERYVDAAGHECAYYDTTLLFPKDVTTAGSTRT